MSRPRSFRSWTAAPANAVAFVVCAPADQFGGAGGPSLEISGQEPQPHDPETPTRRGGGSH